MSFEDFARDLEAHDWGTYQDGLAYIKNTRGKFYYHPAGWGDEPWQAKLSISSECTAIQDPQGRWWVCRIPYLLKHLGIADIRRQYSWDVPYTWEGLE